MANATTTKRAKHNARHAAARTAKWLMGAAALAATLLGWMGLSAQHAAEQAALSNVAAASSAAVVSPALLGGEASIARLEATSRQRSPAIRRVQLPPRVIAITRSSR